MEKSFIIYVDDEVFLCEIFESALGHLGYPIKTFSDPDAAIEFIKYNKDQIKIVFLDYRIGGTTGVEIIKKLNFDLPYYILTGDLAIVHDLKMNQIKQVINKPVEYEQIEMLVKSH